MAKYFPLLTALLSCWLLFLSGTGFAGNDSLPHAPDIGDNDMDYYYEITMEAADLVPEHMDSARQLLERSSVMAGEGADPEHKATWLNIVGNYHWYSGNIDSAMTNYRLVYNMEDPELDDLRASAAVNLGSLFNRRGLADSIRYYHNRSVEIYERLGDEDGLARSKLSLGIFHTNRNNYELAIRYLREALEYQESVQDTFNIIYVCNALGNTYGREGSKEKSLAYFDRAIHLSEAYKGKPILPVIYNNKTSALIDIGDYEAAIENALRGLEIASMKNQKGHELFHLYVNLGVAYQETGRYTNALTYFHEAMEKKSPSLSRQSIAGGHIQFGGLYLDTGDHRQAREQFQKGLEIAKQVESFFWQRNAYEYLFQLDSLEGNYVEAIDHLQKAAQMRDTIWQEERADKLAELEIMYETEQREAEKEMLVEANLLKEEVIDNQQRLIIASLSAFILLVLLAASLWYSRLKLKNKNRELESLHSDISDKQDKIQKQNARLDKQNLELKELNKTKDKLVSIIAHDFRGPFNSLMGYLNIITEQYDQLPEQQKRNMLTELQQVSHRTYDHVNNLLDWSATQRNLLTNNPENIDIVPLANQVIQLIEQDIRAKEIRVQNNLPSRLHCYADPKLLRSVLINLINNAVKYTPDNGQITLEGSQEASQTWFCVTDTGIGIPEEKLNGLFQLSTDYRQEGTNGEKGHGLGLITVKEFISLMEGSLHVSSEPGKGSTFCFYLPTVDR